jgi:hypothetical protein
VFEQDIAGCRSTWAGATNRDWSRSAGSPIDVWASRGNSRWGGARDLLGALAHDFSCLEGRLSRLSWSILLTDA